MKARNNLLLAVVLVLVCAASVNAQTPIPIANNSFETFNPLIYSGCGGSYNSGPIPNWTITGSGVAGSQHCGTQAFTSLSDGPTAAFSNGPTITQDLGISAQNGTYALTFSLGHRLDCCAGTAVVQLLAGTTSLGSLTVAASSIPAGTFGASTLTVNVGSNPPPGNLIISLGCSTAQCDFDNISLTFTSAVPPISVSVAPANSTVPAGQTGNFTATVLNDSANAGVNWTVSSGSVSPTSGTQTTYTAPQFVPANNQVTLTASSVTDPTKSGTATITIPHQAALSWTDSANPAGSVTYSVLRSAANPSTPFCPAVLSASYTQLVSGLTVMNYTDATIAASTSYCYEVVAVANNQSGIAGVILFVPGSVTTITVASLYPWFYNQLIQPMTTLTVKQIS